MIRHALDRLARLVTIPADAWRRLDEFACDALDVYFGDEERGWE